MTSALVVSHLAAGAPGGSAERTQGIIEGLESIGVTTRRYVLEPDTRLRNRRLEPWWYHTLSAEAETELTAMVASVDALIVCYLPVARALLPVAKVAAAAGKRVIYAAENDEVAVAQIAGVARDVRVIKMIQAEVMENYAEAWVAGSSDAELLQEQFADTLVVELASGARDAERASTPQYWDRSAFTLGSWKYGPNESGLLRLLSASPRTAGSLTVFGSVPTKLRRQADKFVAPGSLVNVKWGGFAESVSAMPALSNGPAIVPVWDGAGTKLRIVELAARGIPIYAPHHAFDGLPTWFRAGAGAANDDPVELYESAFAHGPEDWRRASELAEQVKADFGVTQLVKSVW